MQGQLSAIYGSCCCQKTLQTGRRLRRMQMAAQPDSWATSSETSRAQPSAKLKAITRTGLLYREPNRLGAHFHHRSHRRLPSRHIRPSEPKSSFTI